MAGGIYKTGLVLSGGGTRGFAHLGVLKALNEAGIYPDVVSGTSAGALAGLMYCDGIGPEEAFKIMKGSRRLNYMRPTMPRDGLLQLSGIRKILEDHVTARRFEDLKIPLYVSATDLNNGRPVYFSRGELLDVVIASASIPVLFRPVVINNIFYADGGILDNMPVLPIENQCRLIIGSFVNPVGKEESFHNLIKITERTFMIMMSKEINEKSNKFNLFISPAELRNYGILSPEEAEAVFRIGYRATREKLRDSRILKLFS
ncbi:MAG TPA: patatin-like phospholipase family protein [Bacteroidales bacterium]|jgi:NTE family protein|nr:patatin-like phospholipase family protein [Bacteroidales bacterium]HOS72931.1 patatin-like phospholipase family protein [Bacteroidales bacterium]HQH23190.1 patatin-like phospholipase family protein [Bacteroidales bacterium]HQJ80952.1 patatin-like phospholipase family protein [Bacteroidales bacterium]